MEDVLWLIGPMTKHLCFRFCDMHGFKNVRSDASAKHWQGVSFVLSVVSVKAELHFRWFIS